MSKITKSFDVYGMHCKSCETAIEEEIKNLNGVVSVDANHNKSNVLIVYDNDICNENKIKNQLKMLGTQQKKILLVNF
ncbi:heavy-metal-associated domain-containing protein [Paraclostridium sp. AKS81]|uniref:heavy-metal-associated domain-containing protein n=1 Tax=Paraclostridium sp. AKS81 TaxID=2876117 RepID=UPI0021E087E0|nr:heavy-metal-associated domain-containing protein [Paraclostridium sp. AKS81]MCU9813120.1 cation transporter [Paraclostridium sp. AKS81]